MPPFQAFLDEHREPVYRFLYAMVGPDAADDCFQETFLAALAAYPELRHASNLKGWVMTIAHRKALDHFRAAARRPTPVPSPPEPDLLGPLDGDPDLWARVGDLPPAQRAAVVHRYVNDLTYAGIATLMGCSEEAARHNAHAGLRKLKGVMR